MILQVFQEHVLEPLEDRIAPDLLLPYGIDGIDDNLGDMEAVEDDLDIRQVVPDAIVEGGRHVAERLFDFFGVSSMFVYISTEGGQGLAAPARCDVHCSVFLDIDE